MEWIQKHLDWLGHIIEMIVIAAVIYFPLLVFLTPQVAAYVALAFGVGHFHGREKRDYEVSVGMKPPHIKGHEMWKWSWDQKTDFWPTAFVGLAISAAIYFGYIPLA